MKHVMAFVAYVCKSMIGAVPLVLLVSACSALTPHENFKVFLYRDVGKSVDGDPRFLACSSTDKGIVAQESLSNGNIEYKHQYLAGGKRKICYY